MSTSFRLLIPPQILQAVYAHAQAELPNECCGLLAGKLGTDGTALVERCYPLVNEALSPVEYSTQGKSMLAAFKDMRQRQIDELAIYHSHPTSEPIPSKKDLADNTYGESVMHLIVSLQTGVPEMRGWWLAATEYREGEWKSVSVHIFPEENMN